MFNFLVVDDSKVARHSIQIEIEELGHKVIGMAINGKEGVEMAKSLNPDIITMDVNMPEMDGISATKLILENNPNAKVIILTSMDDDEMKTDMIGIGAIHYLIKPFTKADLESVLKKFL